MYEEPRQWTPRHGPYHVDPNNRYHHYERLWKQRGLELLAKHLDLASRPTVLDYGCGRGDALAIFGSAGCQVVGADVDPECVRLASNHGASVQLTDNDLLGQFGTRSFDVVTCFHVLEHVENPKQTLRALSEIARAYVVVAVPNLRSLHRIFVHDIVLDDTVNEGHLQSWDHWHFLNLAERYCGLRLVEWGFDATILSALSGLALRLFGMRATMRLETGLFRRAFPFHGISVLGLFAVV